MRNRHTEIDDEYRLGDFLSACFRDPVVIFFKCSDNCPFLDELINGCEPVPLILHLILDDYFKDV